MVIDIVFVFGIMVLLGKCVFVSLKVFLLVLVIIDDFGVVVIIVLFYSSDLLIIVFIIGFIMMGVLFMFNVKYVIKLSIYLVVGFILWIVVLKLGVYVILVGVVIGFVILLKGNKGEYLLLKYFEYVLYFYVVFVILFVFVFVNVGILL